MNFKSDRTLNEILKLLKAEFNPTKVFLFGSRANGTNRSDSDYDLILIVKHTNQSCIQNMIRSQKLLWDIEANVDVFVYDEDEFNQLKNDFSSIPEIAMRTGQEISLV